MVFNKLFSSVFAGSWTGALSLKLMSFECLELAQPRSELSLYLGRKEKVAVVGVQKGRVQKLDHQKQRRWLMNEASSGDGASDW